VGKTFWNFEFSVSLKLLHFSHFSLSVNNYNLHNLQETELPEIEAKKREHESQPYPSPTHAGGLFAINR